MMRMEPLYRATWTTPESWSVELEGEAGTEGRSFFIAEGRADGRLSGRLRAANFPRRRVDGALTPGFRGVLETDDAQRSCSPGRDTPVPAPTMCANSSDRSRT